MLKLIVLSISIMLLSPPVINGILPEIRDSLALTQAQSELITTIPSIACLFAILLSNVAVKKIGIRWIIFIGLMLVGLGGVLPVIADSFMLVLVGRIVLGLGLGLYSPLAIDLINILFAESERAKLMGYRSAIEQMGQSLMSLLAGLLAVFSWNASFLVYGFAFLLAILFLVLVPEINLGNAFDENKTKEKERLPFIVYPIVLLAVVVVLTGAAIGIRFPALAVEVMGDGYNSSLFFVLKPIIGICAGFFFGKLHRILGRKLLYIGLACLGIASFLIGFSNGNFSILVVGFLLSSLVPAWIFPFIFMLISKRTVGLARKFSMSLILFALHATVFIMTPVVVGIEQIVGSSDLVAPYPVLGSLVFVVLAFIIVFGERTVQRN